MVYYFKKKKKILIANRGEIALRAIKATRQLGFSSVSVFSKADKNSVHVLAADESICIGSSQPKASYLLASALIHIAKEKKCDAVYPGYGFLSENHDFAAQCEQAGLIFIGPSAKIIQEMGQKDKAREIAAHYGVPIVPGSNQVFCDCDEAFKEAKSIGFPVLLKARSGGGGKGMRIVSKSSEFRSAFGQAMMEADAAFADGYLYIEKFFSKVRHIEIQVLGDGSGEAVAFDERDCSIQRRHQKLIEESPSPVIDEKIRKKMKLAACNLARGIKYGGAGTIEFIYDCSIKKFFFIEMNTRIQVEHPITEIRNNFDLVEAQFRIALNNEFPKPSDLGNPNGHAIEFRINAEDPENNFFPSPGIIKEWYPPCGTGIRVDAAVYSGCEISPYYDSMIGKLIIYDKNRKKAIEKARDALDKFLCNGVRTTISFHRKVIDHDIFLNNEIHTRWVETEFSNNNILG